MAKVRPGIAVSIVFHIALVIYLSYQLAIPPTVAPPPDEESIDMSLPPPPPPAAPPPKTSQALFIPSPAPALAGVTTSVPALPIPAEPELKHTAVVKQEAPKEEPKKDVILQPKPAKIVPPDYPSRAQDRNLEGVVEIDFTIEPDGSVGSPKVVSETPEGYGFAAAAIQAFPKWKFTPKKVNDKGVAAAAHYRFRFKIN